MATTTLLRTNETRVAPAALWAALGGFFLLLQLYVYARWIGSPDFRATAPGPDPVPAAVLHIIHGYQVGNSVLAVLALAWLLWGLRGGRELGPIRLMMIGWLSAYWLDPWLNFLRPMFTYNSYMVNRGCWCRFMPFWHTPNGDRIAEPLLVDPASYFTVFVAVAVLAWWVMRKLRAARPATSPITLALAGFASIWATMSLLDVMATRTMGFDAWPISFRAATLWAGQYYQFPIYEFILFPAPFVACGFLLLHVDSHGRTIVERGADRFTGTTRTVLRTLGFIAFCNVANLSYTTAMGVHALFADPWPAHMPSWLADDQCGPLTGQACAASPPP